MATVSKLELRRELRDLYRAPAEQLAIVEVPDHDYLMSDGAGPPAGEQFITAVDALYSVSWALKFALKREGVEFAVMPLEGLWWNPERWTLMIAQPEEVTEELVAQAVSTVAKRRDLPSLRRLRLERFHEGLAAQVTHVGPYADEHDTLERLEEFVETQGFQFVGTHHEIYLGDPRRTPPTRLRTIMRVAIAPAPDWR